MLTVGHLKAAVDTDSIFESFQKWQICAHLKPIEFQIVKSVWKRFQNLFQAVGYQNSGEP